MHVAKIPMAGTENNVVGQLPSSYNIVTTLDLALPNMRLYTALCTCLRSLQSLGCRTWEDLWLRGHDPAPTP